MTISPSRAISEFCALCDWAYQANQLHRALFDDNPNADQLSESGFGYGFAVMSGMTLEYALLQIAKLHDKAVVSGKITLSIDYILNYGGWKPDTQAQLQSISSRLERHAAKLRSARNQALSHNDLAAILAGGVLGEFEKDEDLRYFDDLREFADIVSRESLGRGFSYKSHVKDDFKKMAMALSNGPGIRPVS